jgi:hypothetical protein
LFFKRKESGAKAPFILYRFVRHLHSLYWIPACAGMTF